MSQLGERLQAAREAQGVSLAQASADTRILQRYIVALEDGNYQHLPGDVYARGFIRNYAAYLGIPADDLIELYRLDRGTTDPIRVRPPTSTPRIRGLFVPSFFGVFFVVFALIGVSYLVLNLTNNLGPQRVAEVPLATGAPTPPPLPTWAVVPTLAPALAAAPTPTLVTDAVPVAGGTIPTPRPTDTNATPDGSIAAAVRIAPGDHNGSWVRITADRKVIYEGGLAAGETREFTAKSDVKIRVGNAGVVFVTVNGVEQGPLGGVGQIFNYSWPPR